jgi:aldehyde:ferredoxin oxidoreductase
MYGGTILLLNLSDGEISREPTSSYSGDYLGGRGINIKLLYDKVSPGTDPLDPTNYIIFGVGPICGFPIPGSRTEVTSKSPETGFLGSTNFGGFFGPELKFAGYDHVLVTGRAEKPVYIWIDNDNISIRDASKLWGKDTYETQMIIRSEVDPEAQIACIGPAGENCVRFATIQHELGHGGGRTGLGAVMGSKNLKAIVVRGTKGLDLAYPERFLSIAYELEQELRNDPGIQEVQKNGWAPIEDAGYRYAASLRTPRRVCASDLYYKYPTKRTGCFGCPVQCMELFPVEAKGGGTIS